MAKKISRKELLKKDDAFIAAAGQSVQWAQTNRQMIIGASVAGAVLILAVWGSFEYLKMKDKAASEEFQKALSVMESQVIAPEDVAEDAEGQTYATDKAKWEAALKAFEKVQEVGGSSGVGQLARFYAGSLQAKLGNKEVALEIYGALAQSLSPDDELYFLAKERQAYLYEALGQHDKALDSFSELARGKTAFYEDYAGLQQARLLLAKGETDKARNILERLQKDFPDSSLKEDIERRLKTMSPAKDSPAEEVSAKTNTN